MNNQAARTGRNQLKLQKLRNQVRQSTNAFMARHQARLAWWKQTFHAPVFGMQWLFQKAKTLAHAIL